MAESLPLDPLGGIVNYLDCRAECPPAVAKVIVESVAIAYGLGVHILPDSTNEERRMIDFLAGADSFEQQIADIVDSVGAVRVHSKPRSAAVFLTRFSGDQTNYPEIGERHERLHDTIRDLTGRLN